MISKYNWDILNIIFINIFNKSSSDSFSDKNTWKKVEDAYIMFISCSLEFGRILRWLTLDTFSDKNKRVTALFQASLDW